MTIAEHVKLTLELKIESKNTALPKIPSSPRIIVVCLNGDTLKHPNPSNNY